MESGTSAKVTHDIIIGNEIAFAEGETVKIEAISLNEQRPQYKYVVTSSRMGKRFQLSDADLTEIEVPQIQPTAPSQVVVPPRAPVRSQVQAPVSPPAKKSKKLKWVLLAVGIFVVIVIIAAAVSSGKKTSTNKTTTTSSANTAGTAKSTSPSAATSTGQTTGANQTTYNVPTEAEIGIPFYPGAVVNTQRTIKDHSANKSAASQAGIDMVDLEVTGQSFDEVTNWYQKQLASKPNYITTLGDAQDSASFSYDEGGYNKLVDVYDFT